MVATAQAPRPLSPRQQEVLRLLGQGFSNRQIAIHMGIVLQAAKNLMRDMRDRLGLETRDELEEYAREQSGGRNLDNAEDGNTP